MQGVNNKLKGWWKMIEVIKCNICKKEKRINISDDFRISETSGAVIGMKCPFPECESNQESFKKDYRKFFFNIHVKRKLATITKERIEYIYNDDNFFKILGISTEYYTEKKISVVKTRYNLYIPLMFKPRKKKVNKKDKEIIIQNIDDIEFGSPGNKRIDAINIKIDFETWLNGLDLLKKGICYLFKNGYNKKEAREKLEISEKKLYRESLAIKKSYQKYIK